MNLKSLFFEPDTNVDMADVAVTASNGKAAKITNGNNNDTSPAGGGFTMTCPLRMWNRVVRRATEMTVERDLRPAYLKMCTIVNEYELGWQMT